jgi:micrococcal nuclease
MRTALLLPVVLLALAGCVDEAPHPDEVRQDCRAVDGDTLRCPDQTVRLRGVDTPEIVGRCTAEREAARAARARLAEIAADGLALRPHGQDRFGRTVATLVTHGGRARPAARGPKAAVG